jgi:hypothetical protein
MSHFDYSDSPYSIRQDMAQAYRAYWDKLAGPGSWFSGAERVAIAAEVRNALVCPFCAERKQALSPYTLKGEHFCGEVLDERAVDAVHRVVTDQARITGAWVADHVEHGLSQEQYAELVGIVVTVFSIDEFNRAMGLPPEPLPAPRPGEPDHYRPPGARHDDGFLAMLTPESSTDREADLWPGGRASNVVRALSLVPDAVRDWRRISDVQYIAFHKVLQVGADTERTLNRMQIELVAGRVSSINECFY